MTDKHVHVNIFAGLNGYRISQQANRLEYSFVRSPVDVSDIENLQDQVRLGPYVASATFAGLTGADLTRAALTAMKDETSLPSIMGLTPGGAAGSPALLGVFLLSTYSLGGQRGAPSMFETTLPGDGTELAAEGIIHENSAASGAIDANGQTTPLELGAVGAGEAAMVIVMPLGTPTGTAPTLDVDLQRDDAVTFLDPVVEHSFAQFTGANLDAEVYLIDGDTDPVTDDWWRLDFTIGGTATPSFLILAAQAVYTKPT